MKYLVIALLSVTLTAAAVGNTQPTVSVQTAKKQISKRGPRGPRGLRGPEGTPGQPGVQGPVGPVKMSALTTVDNVVVPIDPGKSARMIAQCPHNYGVISGGFRTNFTDPPNAAADSKIVVTENRAALFGWMIEAVNTGPDPASIQAIAYCVPIGDAARG